MEKENFVLSDYMGSRIGNVVKGAIKSSFTNPKEAVIIMKYLMTSKNAKMKRDNFEKNGEHIPSFLIASITNNCNLYCKGCYARANHSCGEHMEDSQMSGEQWNNIFTQAEELGVLFILLAGGEPLLRRDVIKLAAKHDRLLFPVFTNGTMIDEEYLKLFDKKRNVVPVLSIEGGRQQTDDRRGAGTYDTLVALMDSLKAKGILFGASVTVTTENIGTVTSTAFAEMLFSRGCRALLYVEYVPVDKQTKHLAPTAADRAVLEQSKESLRSAFDEMIFISFPGDEQYAGGCLAAGKSFFHVNSNSGAEPCPFSPYSDISLKEHSLLESIHSQFFRRLKDSGLLDGEHEGGCLLFEREAELKNLLVSCKSV
ncbi:radical SAM/SPASM domain-containing protein [Ruminiclostridium cellobioparum]|uniref:Putative Fe-S oxidoreductase n=1 Tax=Ruminiclostridium cellobioparum subsp. termitidis CT1112 TaxID=1195236 RepID=S0FW24_RUMCE|nr:radical SAM protein [Ruminiclostridium cellobioparum]EMS72763.1 putative Fe-S oxidoreductase [Ruminiclostridium cellobioparum subsp. termitidis CT1112]